MSSDPWLLTFRQICPLDANGNRRLAGNAPPQFPVLAPAISLDLPIS